MKIDKKTSRIAFVIVALALAGTGSWGLYRRVADAAHESAGTRWRTGERRAYGVDLSSTITMEADKRLLEVSLAGTWSVQALSVGARGVELASTLRLDRFHAENGAGGQFDLETLRRAFAKPFFFTLDENGMVVDTRVDGATPGLVEGIVRSLAGYVQFHTQAFRQDRFESTETDASGRYTARYERQRDGTVVKSKQRYLEVHVAGGSATPRGVTANILGSRASFGFDGGRLQQLTLDERIEITGADLPPMRSDSRLTLSATNAEADGTDVNVLAAAAKALKPLPLYARVSTEAELARLRAERAREYDVPGLVQKLAALDSKDDAQRAKLFGSAHDLLRADPAAVAAAVAELRKHPKDANFWISALGEAGTPAAQDALIGLQSDAGFDANTRRNIVRALSLVDEHTEATVATLESLVDDPLMGRQAKFGLGTAVHRLHAREPERAAAIVEALQDGLASADNESDRVNYIKALGNAGSEDTIDLLMEQLRSPNGAVRTQAIRALRLMPEGRADQILATEMVVDYDAYVRATAVEAARNRTPTEVVGRALFELVKTETAVLARHEAYQTLLAWDASAPYVGQALAWARANETDPQLKKVVANDS